MHIFVSSGVRFEMNEDKLESLYSIYICTNDKFQNQLD